MTPNDLIVSSFRMANGLVHRGIDDLTPAEFDHQPVPGANSAAWIVGHLAVTYRRVAARLGATELPAISDELAAKLATTKKPADVQAGLGDSGELMKLFDACCAATTAVVATIPSEQLEGPSPFPLAIAPTLGEALLFIGGIHVAMHAGQLTTIHRSLGKPPVV